MANKNLLKKIAPVILSATVAMTGMPSAVFAAEFSDEEVVLPHLLLHLLFPHLLLHLLRFHPELLLRQKILLQKLQKRNFPMQKRFLAQKARQKLLQKRVMLLKAGLYMVQQTFRMPIFFMVR